MPGVQNNGNPLSERPPERGDKAASEELLRQADSIIVNMERELERLRRAAHLYRERQHGPRRNGA